MSSCYISGWGFSNRMTPPIFNDEDDVHAYSSSAMLSTDLKTSFSTIQSEINSKKFNLIGWSLGGMLAIELAHLYPEKIETLVLISTTKNYINHQSERYKALDELKNSLEEYITKDDKKGLMGFYASLIKEIPFKEITDCLPSIRELVSQADFIPSTGLYRGLCYLENTDLEPLCKTLSMPTLIFHGSKDSTIPIDHAIELHEAISASKLINIEFAGHMLPYSHSNLIKENISKLYR